MLCRFNRKLLQDRDSPDQVIASFQTMCDDRDTITADELGQPPLSEEDVAMLRARLPQAANGERAFEDRSSGRDRLVRVGGTGALM